MPDLAIPAALQKILADHVGNLSRCLTGVAGYGQRILLTALEDATNYANTFGNKDTTNGRAVKIQYGDQSGSPVTLATFQKSSSRIQSNDGTDYIDVSNSGVAITGTFTVSGQTVGAGIRVYNVRDYGIAEGTDSTSAAANTTALQSLWTTVATAGGGVIYFPPNSTSKFYPFNATTFNHNLGYSVPVTLMGDPGASIIGLYGTSGPFFDFATTSTHAVSRCGIRDLRLEHKATPTAGATIRLNYVDQFFLDGVKIPKATASLAALICLQLTATANASLRHCKLETQSTGAVTPITIDVANGTATGGALYTYDTDISGYRGASTGIRFSNDGDLDTIILGPGTSIKDHGTSLSKASGTGNVENLIATGVIFDETSSTNILIQPDTGADVATWMFDGACWFSADDYNFNMDEASGGTVTGIQIEGCYLTNADTNAVLVGTGVDQVYIRGNRIASTVAGAGDWVIDANGTSVDVIVSGNRIGAAAGAAGLIRIAATVSPVYVGGNILRGGADADGISFGGATGAARRNENGCYLA